MTYVMDGSEPLGRWIRNETEQSGEIRPGARRNQVRRIQEWLSLHGYRVALDRHYGVVTEEAVRRFQSDSGLSETGIVDEVTFSYLAWPLSAALKPIDPRGSSYGDLCVRYAEQHLAQHPREIGGANRGPWVRAYCNGNDGRRWPWCAFFVTFVMRQAAETLSMTAPIRGSGSCDSLAAQARNAGLFVDERSLQRAFDEFPGFDDGALFLVRRTPTDWTHVGFATSFDDQLFHTIEGNTNDEGSREGYEACARMRGYHGKDFIAL